MKKSSKDENRGVCCIHENNVGKCHRISLLDRSEETTSHSHNHYISFLDPDQQSSIPSQSLILLSSQIHGEASFRDKVWKAVLLI